MKDSVWLYRLYDIAEEFDLAKVEQCLAKDRPTSRLKLTRVRPKSIVIENPPVAVHLGQVNVNIDRKPLTGFLTAKVYDLGVVSLIMRLDLPANISYQELHALALHLYAADLEPVFAEQLNYIKKPSPRPIHLPVYKRTSTKTLPCFTSVTGIKPGTPSQFCWPRTRN